MVLTADGQLLATDGLVADSWTYGAAYNLTVDDLHTYFVGVDQADILVHNTGCTNIADLPKDAVRKLNRDQDYSFARLNENHGVTRIEFGDQVHAIKDANGLPGDFDLLFGPTGDVWNPLSGDLIGNIVHAG